MSKRLVAAALTVAFLGSLVLFVVFKPKLQKNNSNIIGFQRNYLPQDYINLVQVSKIEMNIGKLYSFAGKLYGYDYSKAMLYELGKDGTILKKIGKRGKGPGEFQHIDFIGIDSLGFTFLDTDQSRATQLDKNGVLKNIDQFKYVFSRGICLSPNKYLVSISSQDSSSNEKEHFALLSPQTNTRIDITAKRLVKSMSSNPSISELETDGIFIHSRSDKVFRVSLMAGQFIAFDTAGKVVYNVFTVDKSNIPDILAQKNGSDMMISYAPNARTINYDAAANKQFLFVLSNASHPEIKEIKKGKNEEVIIDIYNTDDGSYYCSIRLPKIDLSNPKIDIPTSIALSNTGFYLLCGTYIYEYSFNAKEMMGKLYK
jgi:hypothetical protein